MSKKLVGTDDIDGDLPVVVIAAIDRRVTLQAMHKSNIGHQHVGEDVHVTLPDGSGGTRESTAQELADGLASLVEYALPAKANLDPATGKLMLAELPDLAIRVFLAAVGSQAAMLALDGERGDWCTRTDLGTDWTIIAEPSSELANWREMTYPASPVQSVAGKVGAVTLVPSDISGTGATGRQLMTAADAASARTMIGAGTSNLTIGPHPTSAMRGDRTQVVDVLPSELNPSLIYFVREP